jgi:hypothetical protein
MIKKGKVENATKKETRKNFKIGTLQLLGF